MNSTTTPRSLTAEKSNISAATSTTNTPSRRSPRSAAPQGRVLNVAFDVGSESLNWSMELGGKSIDGQCPNESRAIRKTLGRIMNEASQYDYHDIRVICESTGAYHRRLLRKLLKMFFGWYRSGRGFDRGRVFVMASQHGKAA